MSKIKNDEIINKQWREGVGGAQKLLPMCVVYFYCSDEPFYSVISFTNGLKSSQQFYNWITHKNEVWFSKDSKLGIDFAIFKGYMGGAEGSSTGRRLGESYVDLAAMKSLSKIRAKDFINLRVQLEEQKLVDNQCLFSKLNELPINAFKNSIKPNLIG